MLTQERRQRIVELVQQRGTISTKELSESLDVSEMTIRRDLEYLDQRSSIIRHFGGASNRSGYALVGTDFAQKMNNQVEEKKRIAAKARSLVKEHESIFVDHSSTCVFLARELGQLANITVVTYSVPVVLELAKTRVQVICAGGTLLQPNECFIGPLAEEMIGRFHADKVFLGTQGVDAASGLSNADLFEVNMKNSMADRSTEVIVLADHTKFQKAGLYPTVPASKIHTLVTDSGTSQDSIDQWMGLGIRVLIAD